MRSGWIILTLMLMPAAGGLAQQQTDTRPARRSPYTPPKVLQSGCPPAVPPASSESVASAGDYVVLERNPDAKTCDHDCPAYRVRIGGDGTVAWYGLAGVVVTGEMRVAIDPTEARALLQRFADHNFWALCSTYSLAPGQHDYRTTLSIAGNSRKVKDVGDAAPSWLRELDLDADRVADTHRWRHGGADAEVFGGERATIDAVNAKAGVTQLMKAAALHPTAENARSQDALRLVGGSYGPAELDRILALQTDINARDSSGWTALMYAAQAGTTDAVRKLLAAGADPRAVSNEGETALFAAVSAVIDPSLKVELLLATNIDVNAADRHGVTPLMVATRYYGDERVRGLLLRAGADPARRDDQGRLAVDYIGTATDAVPLPPAILTRTVRAHGNP